MGIKKINNIKSRYYGEVMGFYITIEAPDKSRELTLRRQGRTEIIVLKHFFKHLPAEYNEWRLKSVEGFIPSITKEKRKQMAKDLRKLKKVLLEIIDHRNKARDRSKKYWRDSVSYFVKNKNWDSYRKYFKSNWELKDPSLII